MHIAKKATMIIAGALLALSVPASAHAFNSTTTGAHGWSSGKTVYAKDTAADNKSAQAEFYLPPASGTTKLTNSGGSGTTLSKTYSVVPGTGRVCAVNNNPLDPNKCGPWN